MGLITVQLALAFLATAALLMVLRRPAVRARLVDAPGGRKRHGRAVPLIGGIGIFLGFAASQVPADFALRDFDGLFVGMAMLLLLGVIDDLTNVRAGIKLVLQIAAALMMAGWSGLVVTDLGGLGLLLPGITEPLGLGAWSVPFTVLCVVTLINAVNMIDGLDGLAAGTVAVALFWLVLAGAAAPSDWPIPALTLLAAVAAFLVFNCRNPWRRRAACFLGDSGSMMLGYALAWFAVSAGGGSERVLEPIAVAWVLALPVTDALVVAVRRMARGHHPFRADREHLHHILLHAGLTPAQAVTAVVALAAVIGGIGTAGSALGVPPDLMALGLAAVVGVHAAIHARARRFACRLRAWRRRVGRR